MSCSQRIKIHFITVCILKSIAFLLSKIYLTLKYIIDKLLLYSYIFRINAYLGQTIETTKTNIFYSSNQMIIYPKQASALRHSHVKGVALIYLQLALW